MNAKVTALIILLVYLLVAALTGCAGAPKVVSLPAPIIGAAATTVAKATSATIHASGTAQRLVAAAPASMQKDLTSMQKDLAETASALALASTQINAIATADTFRENELFATTLALSKTTTKLSRASAAIANRNFIILILVASLGGTLLYILRAPAGRLLAFALRKPLGII